MIHEEFSELRVAGGYRVILADAAVEFRTWSENGEDRSPQAHYDCMSVEEVCAMPVELLAAQDCALFFWTTWPLMPHWMAMIQSWGFDYAGLAWEWIKYNPETGKYAFGGGYGTRKNLEPCLLATRGNPALRSDAVFFDELVPSYAKSVRDFIEWCPSKCIRAPRRDHSRKPDEQYERVEQLFDGPYIELFSRTNRPYWQSWGNEAGKFDASNTNTLHSDNLRPAGDAAREVVRKAAETRDGGN